MIQPGVTIDSRFQILEFVGSGAMCSVYSAMDLPFDRVVALKLLHGEFVGTAESIKRFQREAVAVGSLEHPNIVRAFGFGVFEGSPYMTMEFLQGASLRDIIDQHPDGLPQAVMLPVFKQICEALQHAHSAGIIHRDVKPSNVMIVDENDRVKLVDFGIAKILPESQSEMQELTQSGSLVGTIFYMSPEQLQGKPVDARSDIYSLGCLMYESLTGQPPYTGESGYEIANKHISEEVPFNAKLGNMFPLIAMMLHKDPARRPASVAQLQEMLDNPEAVKATPQIHPGGAVLNRANALRLLAAIALTGVALALLWGHIQRRLSPANTNVAVADAQDPPLVPPPIVDQGTTEQQQHLKTWDSLYSQAKQLQTKKRYREAIPVWQQLIALTPQAGRSATIPTLTAGLAWAMHQDGNSRLAIQTLQEQRRRLEHSASPDDYFQTCSLLADIYDNVGQHEQATEQNIKCVEWLREHHKAENSVALYTIRVASGYKSMREFNKAFALLNKVTPALKNKDAMLYSLALLQTGDTHIMLAVKLDRSGEPGGLEHYNKGIDFLKQAANYKFKPGEKRIYADVAKTLLQIYHTRYWWQRQAASNKRQNSGRRLDER